MNSIQKVSDITYADVAEYLRLTELTQDDISTLNNLIGIATAYVEQYTGREIVDLDDYQDIVIVVLILCQDMWDNRAYYVDSGNVNKVVESILSLHQVNLL